MGTESHPVDKVELVVGRRPLLLTAVEAALSAGAVRVICVGPDRRHELPPGVAAVTEEPPGGGPAAALAAGLDAVRADAFVLLAADLPFIEPGALRHLLALLDADGSRPGVVALDDAGRRQWLLSAWRTAVVRSAVAACGRTDGTSLRWVLDRLSPTGIALAARGDRPPPWFDCDTPEDLARAREAVD